MDFEFDSNVDKIIEGVRKKAPQILAEGVANKISGVRCPVHGAAPTKVTHTGGGHEFQDFNIEGCCDQLIEAIRIELGRG